MFGKKQPLIHIAPQAVENRTDVRRPGAELSPARARLWLIGLGLWLLLDVFGAGLPDLATYPRLKYGVTDAYVVALCWALIAAEQARQAGSVGGAPAAGPSRPPPQPGRCEAGA